MMSLHDLLRARQCQPGSAWRKRTERLKDSLVGIDAGPRRGGGELQLQCVVESSGADIDNANAA